MQIEEFINSVYCCVENLFNEVCKNLKLRQRGFQPKFTDIEVLIPFPEIKIINLTCDHLHL
jgi:hypothetical protein